MIDLQFDASQFIKAAEGINGGLQQLPFAISVAMNTAAQSARERVVNETWPRAVNVRNRTFMNAALRVKRATKNDLSVTLYDSLHRDFLQIQAKGGTKQARGRFAIPSKEVTRTARGVRQSQKPSALKSKFEKNGKLYERVGKGKRAKVRFMYTLAPTARVPKRFAFYEDAGAEMLRAMRIAFPLAFKMALRTRR